MGHHAYTAIVLGTTDAGFMPVDDEGDPEPWLNTLTRATAQAHGVVFAWSTHAGGPYVGVVLAISDVRLAMAGRGVVEMPGGFVVPVEALADRLMAGIAPGRVEAARAAWEALRDGCRVAGVEVPEGRLLYVSDFD